MSEDEKRIRFLVALRETFSNDELRSLIVLSDQSIQNISRYNYKHERIATRMNNLLRHALSQKVI